MRTIIDWILSEPVAVPVLLIGTPAVIVAWALVTARLTRYSARDHDRAYLAHHNEP
jgi:hypothetical protein